MAAEGTFVTYSANRKGVDARARDINVTNVTMQHMGAILLEETDVVLNHGNRYGLVGRNGCGKVSVKGELWLVDLAQYPKRGGGEGVQLNEIHLTCLIHSDSTHLIHFHITYYSLPS